jgi:hypothetical protein
VVCLWVDLGITVSKWDLEENIVLDISSESMMMKQVHPESGLGGTNETNLAEHGPDT